MNCKPGDLAIIVGGRYTPQLIGHIVKVIGPYTQRSNDKPITPEDGVVWEICYTDGRLIPQAQRYKDTKIFSGFALRKTRPYLDKFLRPIRDVDGQDETLTWAKKPKKVKA